MKGSYAMAKKNKRLAKCPYCGRSVSYLDSFFMKNKGEYTCKRCGCIANVGLNRNIYAITSVLCVFVLLLVVLYLFFGDLTNLWSLILVIIPFAAYYAIVPMFLILVPTADKSQAKKVMDKKMTNTQSIFIEAQKQVQSQNSHKKSRFEEETTTEEPKDIYSSGSIDLEADSDGTKIFEPYDASSEIGADFQEKFRSAKKSGRSFDDSSNAE